MLEYESTLKLINQAQNGDSNAKEILVKENYPLIKSVIKPFINRGIEYDDLYQLGSVGFVKAINNFSEKYNVKFSTYAVPMIAGEVKRFLRDDGSIKVSRAIKTLNVKINRFIQEYKSKNFNSPSIAEISKQFNIDESEVVFALDAKKSLLSLDEKQDDSPKSKTLMETIEEPNSEENMINNLMLKEAFSNLSVDDKKLLAMRFFHDMTQSEIAKVFHVSQVQVSRLENKILEKLKTKLK